MNSSQKEILQLKSTVHALEELLAVSESSFLKESKKLEEANELLKKENTYRRFFEASPKAMQTLCDGRFIDCNESTVKILKAKNKDEVLNTHPWDLSPEYQPDGRLSSEKAEEMIATALKNGAHIFEWDHRRLNGEVFPVEVQLTAVTIEGKQMFNSSWRELTEEKRAEKELEEYHKHLEKLVQDKTEEISAELEKHKRLESDIEQILDSSSDAIRVIDKDYNIIYTSKSFNLLHHHPENMLGKKCYDVVPEKECHTKNCSLKRVLETGKKFSTEKELKALDGSTRLYRIDVIPYNDSNGNFLGIIKNYRDITEERQAEKRLADEIREREILAEKYRILFDASGDSIVMFDEKGFFDCNQKTLEIFGYSSKNELIGKTPIDVTTERQPDGQESLTAYNEHVEKAFREGADCFEWFIVRKDGVAVPLEVMLSRMEYQGRTVMLSIARDITERKEAEAKLAEMSEEYRLLFESSADAIVLHDREELIDCNKACLDLFDFPSKEEFSKTDPVQLSSAKQPDGKDSATELIKHMDKACREGRDFFEWVHLRKDGTEFPAEVLLNRMEYQGKIVLQAIIRDITERKEAEEKLADEIREREKLAERYRILFETSGDAIMLFNKKGFFDCNKATLQLFGISSKKQFMKKHPEDLSVPEQPDGRDSFTASNEHIERAFREGADFFEWTHKRLDGTAFPAEVLLSRMEYQGEFVIQATVRDISDRKKAQSAAEENAQQQGRIEMANNMLHDIGNAMTGISSYSLKPQMEKVWQEIQSLYQLRDLFSASEDELVKVFGKDKQRALSNFMKALIASFEGRRAKHIEFSEKISSAVGHVCSVLDLQRHYMKENASPLETKINLPTIINDTLIMLSGSLKKRNIKLTFDVKDKNLNISGDQTRLIRVFLNIIKNTCEAFDETGAVEDGRKLVITVNLHKDKKRVEVVFSDNGIGFEAGSGEKLFERGFTSKVNGSGIGLHECRSIIESHDGTITMKSEGINTGAATIITFPIFK